MYVPQTRAFRPNYVRGGSISSVLQNLVSNDTFTGGLKDLGKSLYSSGKQFFRPIVTTAYEGLKPIAKDLGKQLGDTLLSKKDDLINMGSDAIKTQSEKLVKDLLNSKNQKDLKNIIKSQQNDFKNVGTKIGREVLGSAKNEAQKSLVGAIRDLPTKVVAPTIDKTQEQLAGVISEKSKAKADDNSRLVANLISGSGKSQKKKKGDPRGTPVGGGLFIPGKGYDFNSKRWEGLFIPGTKSGRGLVRV